MGTLVRFPFVEVALARIPGMTELFERGLLRMATVAAEGDEVLLQLDCKDHSRYFLANGIGMRRVSDEDAQAWTIAKGATLTTP